MEEKFEKMKESIHAAVNAAKITDTTVYISGDLSESKTPIHLIGCGDQMVICALLIAVLADQIGSLNDEDAEIVKRSAIVALSMGKDGIAELLNMLRTEGEENASE